MSAALNLRAGLGWPRWGPHLHLGYGYPIHNFYAPGVHIVGGVMVNLGAPPVTALVLVQALGLILYATGAYLFARTFLPARAALLGAAVYAYAPFRFRELWVQGNLSQFVAMGLMPWALWALARAAQRPTGASAAAVALTFAALILAHHPTAFLFAPLAVAYAVIAALYCRGTAASPRLWGRHAPIQGEPDCRKARLYRLVSGLGGLILGLALAAIFWLPALAEIQHVDIEAIERGMFNVSLNFVEPGELLALSPTLDRAALNPPMPHNLGVAQIALAWLGLIALHPRFGLSRWARLHVLLGAAGLLICVIMVLPAAEPIWRVLPLGSIVAFPWRLIGVAEVCIVPMAAASLSLLPARWRDAGLGAGLALTLALAAVYLYPIQPFLHLDDVTPATAIEYELKSGALGTVSADEYLPRWVEEPPLAEAPPPDLDAYRSMRWRVTVDETSLPEGVSLSDDDGEITLGSGESFTLRLRQFYFPGWRAEVDNAPVEVRPSGPEGLIVFDVPAADAPRRVEVWYSATAVQTAATLVSAGALVVCAGAWVWSRRRRGTARPVPTDNDNELPTRAAATLIAAVMIVAAINQLLVLPHTDWFRPRSDPSAPEMMQNPVHVRLGEEIELLGYDLDHAEAAQGEAITVRLYWRALRPLERNYRPFVHWNSLAGTETWANSTLTMPGSAPTSRWDPDLYVIDAHRLAIPPDAPPVVGNLVAGLFDAETGARLPTPDGADVVRLTPMRVTGAWDIDRAFGRSEAATLGGAIKLLDGEALRAGDAVRVRLYWQADAAVPVNYTVFLHVLDVSGAKVGQGDRPPLDGNYPTSLWLPGQVILDEAIISLDSGVAGPLTLAVGLYDPATVTRLETRAADGSRLADDAILLQVVE